MELTTANANNFSVAQQIVLSSTSVDVFDTVAIVTAIVDPSNLTVSASIFKIAGGSGSASQGPLAVGSLVDGGFGSGLSAQGQRPWTFDGSDIPSFGPDAANPNYGLTIAGTYYSDTMLATQFGFNVPSTATITGVLVATTKYQFAGFPFNPTISDVDATLLKAGVTAGNNRPNPSVWPQNVAQPVNYGGSSDMWGTTLTPADVNDPGFGFLLDVVGGSNTAYTFGAVPQIFMTVYYNVPRAPLSSTGGTISLISGVPPIINTTTSDIGQQMGSANPWGHFRSGNRVFISSGASWVGRFFQSDLQSWDGQNLRPAGLPPLSDFSNATGGPVVVSVTGSTAGSIAPTLLSGYQLYGAIYNPYTQHMGNCFPLGTLQTVSDTQSAFVLTWDCRTDFSLAVEPLALFQIHTLNGCWPWG